MRRLFNSKNNFKFEIAPDAPRMLAIVFWILLSTTTIWVIDASQGAPPFNLLSFVRISLLLFTGGFAYHFLTMLIEAPFTEENKSAWWQMVRNMFFAMSLISAYALALTFAQANWSGIVFIILLIPVLFSMLWYFYPRVESAYKKIHD